MTASRPHPSVVLVHKPVGVTSFSIVQEFQARLAATPGKAHKLCHGGALDPFAEGLLPVLVGPATKLFEWLHEVPKLYRAEVAWGAETDSGDGLGRVVREAPVAALTPARLDEALRGFLGWTEQVPPSTSNKRVGGERAYQKAHRGEAVELPPSRVYLHSARWVSHALPEDVSRNRGGGQAPALQLADFRRAGACPPPNPVDFATRLERSTLELACRGGFYVRSLARDLARALGTAAHLLTLHRRAIGPWEDPGPGQEQVVTGPEVLPWLSFRLLTDDEWGLARAGAVVPRGRLGPPTWALPVGFPSTSPLVRGVHLDRIVALLTDGADGLQTRVLLPGGL